MIKEKDVLIIYFEDSPAFFARIESILPDIKKDWYHVKFLMLQIPLKVFTWLLKYDYINGDEFSLDGKNMRIKKIKCPEQENMQDSEVNPYKGSDRKKEGKVVFLSDFKKNKIESEPE